MEELSKNKINEKDFQLEATTSQVKKIELLQQATNLFKGFYDEQAISNIQLNEKAGPFHKNTNALNNQEVWLYDKNNEDKIAKHLNNQEHVWLSNNSLNGSFEQVLDKYLDEIVEFNTKNSVDVILGDRKKQEEFIEFIHNSFKKTKDLIIANSDKLQKIKDEWEKIEKENIPSDKAFSNIARTG